jgi:hypothetical protein
MNKEWNSLYFEELNLTKNAIQVNTEKTREFYPRYTIKKEYLSTYPRNLEDILKKQGNPFLKFSYYQEYRILSLIDCLEKSKKKIFPKDDIEVVMNKMKIDQTDNNYSSTSQIILVNNIVKNNSELITSCYLLEWLQRIYSKEEFSREMIKERPNFTNSKQFHPDMLNSQGFNLKKDDMDNFVKLLDILTIMVRQGKLEEAQIMAEYYDQSFLSAMLSGGLAMNDLLLDGFGSLSKVDWDLFPPFMKNKEFYEIKEKANPDAMQVDFHSSQLSDNKKYSNLQYLPDSVIGNPDWPLWLSSVYEGCNLTYEKRTPGKDKIFDQVRLLRTFISGNVDFVPEINNVYDTLYVYCLALLNSKILIEYGRNVVDENHFLDYHFNQKENMNKQMYSNILSKTRENSLYEMLELIKTDNLFKQSKQYDLFIELEFMFISLYLIEQRNPNDKLFYLDFFEKILNHILKLFENNEEFERCISEHYKRCKNNVNPNMTQNVISERDEENVSLIKLNYFKIIFEILVNFYSNNQYRFYIHDQLSPNEEKKLEDIATKYDYLISLYFDQMSNFILRRPNIKAKPTNLVYILGYCLDELSVQRNLISLAKKLDGLDNENFKSLYSEIEKHFYEYREVLISVVANGTHIYVQDETTIPIDFILQRDITKDHQISLDDKNRIEQVRNLFLEGNLENFTKIKHMLKLCIKFLANKKFHESSELEHEFRHETNIYNILGPDFSKKNKIETKEWEFLDILEKIKNLNAILQNHKGLYFENLAIFYLVLVIKIINNCYTDFLDFCKFIKNQNEVNTTHKDNLIREKICTIFKNFKMFYQSAKIYVLLPELNEMILNFFNNEIYKNFLQIISDWIYQVLKWTTDLYLNQRIKNYIKYDR